MVTQGAMLLEARSALLSTFKGNAPHQTDDIQTRWGDGALKCRLVAPRFRQYRVRCDVGEKQTTASETELLSLNCSSEPLFWLLFVFFAPRDTTPILFFPSSLPLVRFNRHTRNRRLTYIAIDKKRGASPPTNHGVGLPQVAMPLSLKINLTASPKTNIQFRTRIGSIGDCFRLVVLCRCDTCDSVYFLPPFLLYFLYYFYDRIFVLYMYLYIYDWLFFLGFLSSFLSLLITAFLASI